MKLLKTFGIFGNTIAYQLFSKKQFSSIGFFYFDLGGSLGKEEG